MPIRRPLEQPIEISSVGIGWMLQQEASSISSNAPARHLVRTAAASRFRSRRARAARSTSQHFGSYGDCLPTSSEARGAASGRHLVRDAADQRAHGDIARRLPSKRSNATDAHRARRGRGRSRASRSPTCRVGRRARRSFRIDELLRRSVGIRHAFGLDDDHATRLAETFAGR